MYHLSSRRAGPGSALLLSVVVGNGWMARVTAAVLWTDIDDAGLRVFRLYLERGYERVFGCDRHVTRLALELEAYGELHVLSYLYPLPI